MRLIDLTGQKFGMLTVLGRSEKQSTGKSKRVYWRCRCDCGNVVDVLGLSLKRGATQSCGCMHSKQTSERCLSVKPGDKYGRLTVIKRHTPVGVKPVKWECLCECGNTVIVTTDHLKDGHTQSCGCLHSEVTKARSTTHGHTNTRLYNIWCGMKSRCNTPSNTVYKNYGALGVKVCEEWEHDFQAFHDWAFANGYDPDAPRGVCTLDRIDPYGDYEPSNCRWVDMATQSKNKRKNSL